jgi:hypothetical protein
MSPQQLSEYREWFLGSIPSRIAALQDAVKESGDATWQPDFTKASIDLLGLWMAPQVEVRQRTADEIDRLKSKTEFNFDISDKELSNKTFSLAMDVGMYLGATLLNNFPNLSWDQPMADKKFVDFGQMVLLGLGKVPFNPVRITITFCYGIGGGQQTGKRLGEIYDYWARLASAPATVR